MPLSSSKGAAIVTGGARGLGKAIALRLAKDGYDISLNDIEARERELSTVAKEIGLLGRNCIIVLADVTDERRVVEMIRRTVCFREATRLLSLPQHHPLFTEISSERSTGPHPTPIEAFKTAFSWAGLHIESIETRKEDPEWTPPFLVNMPIDKGDAILEDLADHRQFQIYSDGSSINEGVGAAAVLYDQLQESSFRLFHLGTSELHTVFEAELVGILLAIQLIIDVPIDGDVTVALDNKAAISACLSRQHGPGHHIAQEIQHNIARLRTERPNLSIHIRWVPGHMGVVGNDKADKYAKEAAAGPSSSLNLLPLYLHVPLPISVSALKAAYNAKIQLEHTVVFRRSVRCNRLKVIDSSAPSRQYWKLSRELSKRRASILIQLRTGHIPLNHHLHRIKLTTNPFCPHCAARKETIFHFLLACPHYRLARDRLRSSLPRNLYTIKHLLHNSKNLSQLWKYIDETKRLIATFGLVNSERPKPRPPK